jgi:hypothetical protein
MSARSGVFVFDYDAHVNCVAPAVRRAMTRRQLGPWLQEVWDARQRRFAPQCRSAALRGRAVRLSSGVYFCRTSPRPCCVADLADLRWLRRIQLILNTLRH